MREFPEVDWKRLRSLKDTLLERASQIALQRIKSILAEPNAKGYQSYLGLWDLLQAEDKKIADMFNDLKRSNAFFKMAYMIRYGILQAEELKKFTEETRKLVDELAKLTRPDS